jgi:hemoglobin-like flavoprotein
MSLTPINHVGMARDFFANSKLKLNPIKENTMTLQQIELLQNSFARVLEQPEQTASLFYQRLFKLDPSLNKLFPNDLTKQQRKLIEILGDLTRLEVILPAVQRLGERHTKYGVIENHYDTVGTSTALGARANSRRCFHARGA